jgi:predicted transcriptional regulator
MLVYAFENAKAVVAYLKVLSVVLTAARTTFELNNKREQIPMNK